MISLHIQNINLNLFYIEKLRQEVKHLGLDLIGITSNHVSQKMGKSKKKN